MSVNCEDLKKEIEKEFKGIKDAAPNGNITDEMAVKSNFNKLVALAKAHCNTLYSIEWSSSGYVLIAKPYQ